VIAKLPKFGTIARLALQLGHAIENSIQETKMFAHLAPYASVHSCVVNVSWQRL